MDISELKDKVKSEISSVKNIDDIKKVKVFLLGRKGIFADFLDRLKTIDKDLRRDTGKAINDLKIWTENKVKELENAYEEQVKKKREAVGMDRHNHAR